MTLNGLSLVVFPFEGEQIKNHGNGDRHNDYGNDNPDKRGSGHGKILRQNSDKIHGGVPPSGFLFAPYRPGLFLMEMPEEKFQLSTKIKQLKYRRTILTFRWR